MSLYSYIKGTSGNILDVSNSNRALVSLPGVQSNIPDTVDRQTTTFETFSISNKGQPNEFLYRPVLQNENSAYKDAIVVTLNGATLTNAVQIFRASADNLNTLAITTKAIPVTDLSDNFIAGWTSSAPTKITVTNGAIDQYYNTSLDVSNSSLKMALGNNVTGTTVSKIVTNDWSIVSTFSFWLRSTQVLSFYIQLSDGVNTATWSFANTGTNVWEQRVLILGSPTSVSGTLNIAAITAVRFAVTTGGNLTGQSVWIDALEAQQAPGNLYLRIYDLGTNIKPTSLNLGTLLTLDDGNTQLQVPNPIVKNTQRVPLKIGVSTVNTLKIGNYYAIVFYNNGSGIVDIYGSSTSNTYLEGNVFTSNDNGTTLVHMPDKAISFCIFSHKECYIKKLIVTTNYAPGQARVICYIYSLLTKQRENTLLNNVRLHNQQYTEVMYSDVSPKLHYDDSLSITYVDDISSSATEVQIASDVVYRNFNLWVGQSHITESS